MFDKTRFWAAVFLGRIKSGFDRPELTLGQRGEKLAAKCLRKKKYRIIQCNYRQDCGEIDIVALDARILVFVEVKTRASDKTGLPVMAVDQVKQQKIIRTANTFLKMHQLTEQEFRFDIVSVIMNLEDDSIDVRHYIDAFCEE